jgi:hypothetical protein
VNGLIIPDSRGTCHRDLFRVRPVLAQRNANLRTQARWQGLVLEVAAVKQGAMEESLTRLSVSAGVQVGRPG